MTGLFAIAYLASYIALMTQKRFRIRHILGLLAGLFFSMAAPWLMPLTLGLLAISPRSEAAKQRAMKNRNDREMKNKFRLVIEDCDRHSLTPEQFLSKLRDRDVSLVVDRENGEYRIGVRQAKDNTVYYVNELFRKGQSPFDNKAKFTPEFLASLDNPSAARAAGDGATVRKVDAQEKEPAQVQSFEFVKPAKVEVLFNRNSGRTVFILPGCFENAPCLEDVRRAIRTGYTEPYICFSKDRDFLMRDLGVEAVPGIGPKNDKGYVLESATVHPDGRVEHSWTGNDELVSVVESLRADAQNIDKAISDAIQVEYPMRYSKACTVCRNGDRGFDVVVNGEPVVQGRVRDDGDVAVSFTGSDRTRLMLEDSGVPLKDYFHEGVVSPSDFSRGCWNVCTSDVNIASAKADREFYELKNSQRQQVFSQRNSQSQNSSQQKMQKNNGHRL